MTILQSTFGVMGQDGVTPRRVQFVSTDNLATITSANYLTNQGINPNFIYATDIFDISYNYNANTGVGTYIELTPTIVNGVITLNAAGSTIVLPTIASHIATYINTEGGLSEDPTTAISAGNIQAGLSGTAGSIISYPATATTGSLALTGVSNTGNTVTTLSNDAMAQTSTINIPDPGNAVGQILVGATATPFVSGNFPKNSGTAGLMVDSAVAVAEIMQLNIVNTLTSAGSIVLNKVNGTEATNAVTADGVAGQITTSSLTTAGGSNYAITWTNTSISATSVVLLTIAGGTNTTENVTLKVVRGAGTATMTIYNNTAATALNGTIIINYLVM
jgi:hypothetical protein